MFGDHSFLSNKLASVSAFIEFIRVRPPTEKEDSMLNQNYDFFRMKILLQSSTKLYTRFLVHSDEDTAKA